MGFSVGMKLVLAAAILMVIGGVLMFILQGGSGDFTDFISGQTDEAVCQAGLNDYRLACDCDDADNKNTQEAESIRNEEKYAECDWTQSTGGTGIACGGACEN